MYSQNLYVFTEFSWSQVCHWPQEFMIWVVSWFTCHSQPFLLKLPPWRLRRPEAEGHSHQNSGCRPLARWVFPRTGSAWDLVWGLLGTRGAKFEGQVRTWLGTMTQAISQACEL